MKKKDIHTQTIDQLVYDLVTKKAEWGRETHLPGCAYECDLYIFNNGILDLYEVKTTTGTKQRKKAKEQLKHDIIYVPRLITTDIEYINAYYVHSFNRGRYRKELLYNRRG